MIRLETVLLLGIGIALVPRSADGQVTFPRRPQGSNICISNQNQEWPNSRNGFMMCTAAGAVGTFMQCPAGTLFDNTLGNCNAFADVNNQCQPGRDSRGNIFCTNNQRQGVGNNFRNNNRRNNNPRRAQFRNTNSFNTFPPFTTNNNNNNNNNRFGRNPFQNQNNRFNGNQNQNNRFNGNQNQNRFNGNRNTGFTRIPNQNTRYTSRPNRFDRTQNNRFQTNTNNNRNRFNTIRVTPPNGNRGPFQAPERIQVTFRDVRPNQRDNCRLFEDEVNRAFSRLARGRLGTRRVPVLSIQCLSRQNTRG